MERNVLINPSDNYRACQLGAWLHITGFRGSFQWWAFLSALLWLCTRVTGGSLWDKRWLLRPIDLFILSFAARTSCASLKQTFLFYCLWKELIKNQLQEITHKQKLVFIYAGYLLKTKKIIKPQAHTMKCAYLRLPTTNMSVPWLSNERLVPHQQEKSYAWGRGGQLSPLPESPGHYSILWVSRKSLERPFSPENLVLQRARK